MRYVFDARVRRLDKGRVLLGGDSGRLVRLRDDVALEAALSGRAPRLAARLREAGLVHADPPAGQELDVAVVIPVRDRVLELDRCLTSLGRAHPVLVVDDGSRQPAAVADVAARHGARVLHLAENGGPAAARNAGVAATCSEFVALVDSDCVPPEGWLEVVCGHFDDPSIAAVAPRVRSRPGATVLARYSYARGPLDLGAHPALVRPGGRVPYVPTAALVVRRALLPDPPFDPTLRYGEDVDLVWRLHDAGARVQYEPRTVVIHQEPDAWRDWLVRRYRYGTSAAPLATRHPERLAPVILPPWPTLAWLSLLAGMPALAAAAAAVPAVRLSRALRRVGLSRAEVARESIRSTGLTVGGIALGFGGAGTVVTFPFLVAGLFWPPTRCAAAVALLSPPLVDHRRRRPGIDVVRWTALRLVEDLAYAAGVWRSCLRFRSAAALRPRLRQGQDPCRAPRQAAGMTPEWRD